MVPPGKSRDDLLLNLGLRLYEMGLSQSSDDWMIFIAADHLNASPLPVNGENPMFLIQVNLEAGDRAASISAYETASKYLDMARRLLMRFNKPWEVEYETTLRVYRATAEVELCQGHFSLGKEVGQQVLENATSLEDKLPTQVAICRAVGREERHMEAFNMSVRILRTLRSLPQRNGGMKINLVKDFLYVKRCFARQSDSEILNKPLMVDQKLQTIMELLSVAAYHAYYCGALVDFLAMILRMLRISLTEGFCTHSGVAMMGYCLFCNSMNDMDGAHRFFRLARDILTITEARELECLQIYVVSHFVLSWKVKHEEVIELYEEAHKVGMESGDFENGLLSLTSRYYHGFVAGHSLSVLRLQFSSLIDKIKVYKLESVQVITIEQMLPIPFLQGTAESPFDPKELATFGPVTNLTSKSYRLLYGYLSRLQLAVYFDEDELANYILQRLSKLPDFDIGFCTRSIRLCFSSLAYSTLYRKCRQRTFLRKARRCLKQLKGLCQVKGTNSWHRCMLMEAHLAAAKGKARATIKASYDHAISAAKRSGNEHDAALGAQLAATYFLSTTDDLSNGDIRSNKTLIREYLLQARELYLRWGAAGLVNRLERVHPEFLESAATLFDHGNSQPISVHSSLCPEADSGFAISHIPSMPTAINEKKYRVEVKDDMSVLTEQSAIWKGAH